VRLVDVDRPRPTVPQAIAPPIKPMDPHALVFLAAYKRVGLLSAAFLDLSRGTQGFLLILSRYLVALA
jgi:hypothetical protein